MRASEQGKKLTWAGPVQKGQGRGYGKHAGGTTTRTPLVSEGGAGCVGGDSSMLMMQYALSHWHCPVSISKRSGVVQVVGRGKRFIHVADPEFFSRVTTGSQPTEHLVTGTFGRLNEYGSKQSTLLFLGG